MTDETVKVVTCVRCGLVPPTDDPWHRGVGALSRTDNKTKICSHCGNQEGLEDYFEHRLTPQSAWPING